MLDRANAEQAQPPDERRARKAETAAGSSIADNAGTNAGHKNPILQTTAVVDTDASSSKAVEVEQPAQRLPIA